MRENRQVCKRDDEMQRKVIEHSLTVFGSHHQVIAQGEAISEDARVEGRHLDHPEGW